MNQRPQSELKKAIESFGLSDGEKTILTIALKFMLGNALQPTNFTLSLPEVKKVTEDPELSDEEKQKKMMRWKIALDVLNGGDQQQFLISMEKRKDKSIRWLRNKGIPV